MFVYQTSKPCSRKAPNKSIAKNFSQSLVLFDQKVRHRIQSPTVCKVPRMTKFRVGFTIKNWWHSSIIIHSINPGTKPFIDCHFVLFESRNKYTWLVYKKSSRWISIIIQIASSLKDRPRFILWARRRDGTEVILAEQSDSNRKALCYQWRKNMVYPGSNILLERLPQNYSNCQCDQVNPKKHSDRLQRPLDANNWRMERFESSTPATVLRTDVLVAQNVPKNAPFAS